MSINNYWSKKSPEIARDIFKTNLDNNNIIMDPFLGSGTSLEGINKLDIDLKFIGVEINQMPLEYADFNANPPKLKDLLKVKKKFTDFYIKNKKFYEFVHEKNKVYELDRIILDLPENETQIKYFILRDVNLKNFKIDKINNPKLFNNFQKIYLKRSSNFKKNIKRDLLLDENSRIAIKSGMYISHLYGPISFYILQEICDQFKNDKLLKIIISSILHLTKYTDLRSQSQFPFWYPKKDAMERNILLLIIKKINNLIKNHNKFNKKIVKKKNFVSLTKSTEKSYMLINKPIQQIDLEIPSNSVDLVFTDPPYYDQVAYSEYLAIWEFFLNYKKNNLFELIQTNRKKNIKNKDVYLNNLKKCFKVISKKMKMNSLAIIYFKDSKLSNVNDFLKALSSCGLNFKKQKHVSKKKYTYKQNMTKETTVIGDSLFYFKKEIKTNKLIKKKYDLKIIENIIFNFTKKYLLKNKKVQIAEILDNGLIKELFTKGYLGFLKDSNMIFKILNQKYFINKQNRNLIEK